MSLSGWCSAPMGAWPKHGGCRAAICGCECHQKGHSMRGSGAQTRYDNGSKSGPESARTDRGQRPHPAKEL